MRLKIFLTVILIPLAVYAANTFYAEVNVKNNFTVTGNTSLGVNTSVVDLHVYRNTSLGSNTSAGNFAIENGVGLTLSEEDANGSNYILLKPPAAVTSNITLTFPDSDGNSGQALVSDGSGNLSFATVAGGSTSVATPQITQNYSFTASVASSALTITLKGNDGSDLSSASPAYFNFRDQTSTAGNNDVVSATSNLSATISFGSTLGHSSAIAEYIYLYAMNASSSAELAYSSTRFDDRIPQNTTAEGGAGGADSLTTLYSTTARTQAPIKYIGQMKSTQTTAGTWTAVPTEITTQQRVPVQSQHSVACDTPAGYGSSSTQIRRFSNCTQTGTYITSSGDSSTLGNTFTINKSGPYNIMYVDGHSSGVGQSGVSVNSTQLTTAIYSIVTSSRLWTCTTGSSAGQGGCSATVWLNSGDVIRAHNGATLPDKTTATCQFRITYVGAD